MMARKVMAGASGAENPILSPSHANLLLMYTMDNISGATLVDESPNANDGTITGATATPGLIGDALNFNGNDHRVTSVGATSTLFTLALWFKTPAVSATEMLFSQDSSAGTGRGLQVTTTGVVFFSRSVGPTFQQTPVIAGLDDDNWHLAVITQNGVELKIWTDGVSQTGLTMPSALAGWLGPAWIGIQGVGNTSEFTGLIDQYRLFDRELTQAEIDALYNGGSGA